MTSLETPRHLGLVATTGVGVGAIVGGGILALAGVAFAASGPGALLAFALNGGIALLTAGSFAELATRFPQNGGTYTYARRVLSIEVAFVVGWVVWFASILAGVLYALGFAAFAAEGLSRLLAGTVLAEPLGPGFRLAAALTATTFYALGLMRRAAGGSQAATLGKLVVFGVLLAGGVRAWLEAPAAEMLQRLTPLLPLGPLGLLQAMGYSFIALQGFDLIAAIAGEVRDPDRNLPRAMRLSLGLSLAIYLPLLFLMATVGAPDGEAITQAAAADPEGFVAKSVESFLGPAGFWLVIGAGVLSMLSALQANLLGASRVAFAMARDRTLPRRLGRIRGESGTPAVAVGVTALLTAALLVAIGKVAAAGAASSLIFLLSFATVHWAALLARRRSGDHSLARRPLVGGGLCLALAAFQAFAVPQAGSIVVTWLLIGGALYLAILAPGARLADASAEARDPELARLRGRTPLVLVPVANPESAASLMGVAATVRTPGVGRILLLSVIETGAGGPSPDHPALRDAPAILAEALRRSFERSATPETLFTIAPDAWQEIRRVAREQRCETVLLGSPRLQEPRVGAHAQELMAQLDTDVVIVRAPHRWRVNEVRRILVPTGGRRDHSRLRTRLLASLTRTGGCRLCYLHALPRDATAEQLRRAERELRALAEDEAEDTFQILVETGESPLDVILRHADDCDLVVMGVRREGPRRRTLEGLPAAVIRRSEVPLVLIGGQRG